MREGGSVAEADDVDVSRYGPEEKNESDGYGDVHPEHSLPAINRGGESAHNDEEDADGAGDESCGMGAAGIEEGQEGDDDKEDTECDGETGQS